MRIRVENGGNQKANFVRNNRLKDRELHCKDRSIRNIIGIDLDMKYE